MSYNPGRVARLKEAFEEAGKLSEAAHEQLVERLLEEIEGVKKRDATLAESQDLLERLAKHALNAHRMGLAKQMI